MNQSLETEKKLKSEEAECWGKRSVTGNKREKSETGRSEAGDPES